jgi:sigma-E factor negative regulatory protein RseC
MQETGDVIEVRANQAAVQIRRQRSERCAGCTACRALGEQGLVLWIETPDLRVGDRVTVDVPLVDPWRALLLVFGIPLAAVVAGIVVGSQWPWLQAALGLTADSAGLALGALGGLAAFAAAWLADRRFSRRHCPRIVEIHRPA